MSYQFQVRSGTTVVYDSGVTGGAGSGNNVTHTPTAQIDPDTNYTWRVRAAYQGAIGSWSSDASFKSPVGAFLRNGELRDPLTIGRTVGVPVGNVTFSSEGATINDQTSVIRYVMDQTVIAGEFSMMVKNIKSAAPGDKSKIMAIQEGSGDITTNDYRFTIEKRGSSYPEPGATTFRIITGDATSRRSSTVRASTVNYDTTHWYLWTARWRTGQRDHHGRRHRHRQDRLQRFDRDRLARLPADADGRVCRIADRTRRPRRRVGPADHCEERLAVGQSASGVPGRVGRQVIVSSKTNQGTADRICRPFFVYLFTAMHHTHGSSATSPAARAGGDVRSDLHPDCRLRAQALVPRLPRSLRRA